MENKHTPLYDLHKKHGANFVPFAGWEMPISYKGITEEHINVREKAGLFDVSHMGDLWIEGTDAEKLLSLVLTMNPANSKAGDCIYAHILNDHGNIIDDMIAIKFSSTCFLCIPNASMTQTILEWITKWSAGMDVSIRDETQQLVCMAIQGPKAAEILQSLSEYPLEKIKFFKAAMLKREGSKLVEDSGLEACRGIKQGQFLLSRTGYTGEDGFEIITGAPGGVWLWEELLLQGQENGIGPIGLGARDTLRLEKGFLLSGTDFNGNRTTLETGWDFALSWDHDFVGKKALEEQKNGEYEKLRGILLHQKAVPRHGMEVYAGDTKVGVITSGGFSPMLGKGIAMAYLPPNIKKGDVVEILIRNKKIPGEVVKPPFLK